MIYSYDFCKFLSCFSSYCVDVEGATTNIPEKKELYVIQEDHNDTYQPDLTTLSGPEMAKLLKIGTRVVRGIDWKWGDQVCKVCNSSVLCLIVSR